MSCPVSSSEWTADDMNRDEEASGMQWPPEAAILSTPDKDVTLQTRSGSWCLLWHLPAIQGCCLRGLSLSKLLWNQGQFIFPFRRSPWGPRWFWLKWGIRRLLHRKLKRFCRTRVWSIVRKSWTLDRSDLDMSFRDHSNYVNVACMFTQKSWCHVGFVVSWFNASHGFLWFSRYEKYPSRPPRIFTPKPYF